MSNVTPEEIKRQAIGFKNYSNSYYDLRFQAIIDIGGHESEIPEVKSDDKLYEEFTEGKQVSL